MGLETEVSDLRFGHYPNVALTSRYAEPDFLEAPQGVQAEQITSESMEKAWADATYGSDIQVCGWLLRNLGDFLQGG